jgi:hypothetical protein
MSSTVRRLSFLISSALLSNGCSASDSAKVATDSGLADGTAVDSATPADVGPGLDTGMAPDVAPPPDGALDVDGGPSADAGPIRIPATTLGPDLMGTVTSAQWVALGGSNLAYDAAHQGYAFTTDATGLTNHEDWQKSIRSPSVGLLAGHAYQFVLRLKTDVFPRGQNLVVTVRDAGNSTQYFQFGWNVSRAGAWEEVVMPVFPSVAGNWRVDVWVSPSIKYTTTPSTIYVDPDLDVYELPKGQEVATTRGIDLTTDKDAFESSTQRIDALGNVYVREGGAWKHVFPKMLYRGTDTDQLAMFQRYRDFGFNGVMDVWTGGTAQAAMDAGLEFVSINTNSDTTPFATMRGYIDQVNQWATTNGRHQNVIWYNYDNENQSVQNYDYQASLEAYVDANHLDPLTGIRRHPIYYLNGNVGLPRTYHNANRHAMDLTGSYVGSLFAVGETSSMSPAPTLLTEFMAQDQRAPVSVIQLQTYLHEKFVPSLFYGIIMGGRAISVWRDGTSYGGTPPDFRNNVWAATFKTEVSPRLDQMLDLIEQPHFTSWRAWTDEFPNVRVGTRELAGTGYLIFANFADQDLQVDVHLGGRAAIEAVDMFTGAHVADVASGSFRFTIGNHNAGYRVLRLVSP